jgi:hypothetical protein
MQSWLITLSRLMREAITCTHATMAHHLVTAVAMDRVQLNEVEDIDLMRRQLKQEPQGCLMLLRMAMEQRHRLHEARLRQ